MRLKVQHDFDAGPGSMADMPFLTVKMTAPASAMRHVAPWPNGNFPYERENGYFTQVFDSNYMTDCADWPGNSMTPRGY